MQPLCRPSVIVESTEAGSLKLENCAAFNCMPGFQGWVLLKSNDLEIQLSCNQQVLFDWFFTHLHASV